MALQIYVTITGRTQGTFKGEGKKGNANRIPVVSYEYEVDSLRDPGTGQATGRRQHKPVVFSKEIDAASPEIFTALVDSEVLTEVVFEFLKVSQSGKETVEFKVTLTNAGVGVFRQTTSIGQKGGPAVDSRPLEEVSLTFQKIELEDLPGQTDASDDWLDG
jgi:type VI secretion system secreted protein Hcp